MDELNKQQNSDLPAGDAANVPAPIADRGGEQLMLVGDGAPSGPGRAVVGGDDDNSPTDPERVMEFDAGDHGDESMRGGYASVNGKRKSGNSLVWAVLIVMSIMCIAVGVCSALLTARFMQKGDRPPIIDAGEVQQNISAVVSARKSCIAEVNCGGLNSSGVVMKREGNNVTVLTNAHGLARRVENALTTVWVRFFGEDKAYAATLVGYDGHYDVAVLNVAVDSDLLYTIYDLDGSDAFDPDVTVNEGDYLVSIGNAMNMGVAVYDGIVSRKSELLQCDELFGADGKKTVPVMRTTAVINAGMSGGGVFDMQGRFVGMGTYRMSNSNGVDTDGSAGTDVEDTGFAVPVSVVYPVYKRILASGGGGAVGLFTVNAQKSNSAIGWLGLPLLGINCEYVRGELTVDAVSTEAAEGIERGDIITAVGDFPVTADIGATVGALLRYHRTGNGKPLSISVKRGDSEFTKTYDGLRYAV